MQKTVPALRIILLSSVMLCFATTFPTFAFGTNGSDGDFVRLLAKSSSSHKIVEGIYWVGSEGRGIKVKARKYQYYDEQGTDRWKPVSELTYIRKGVFLLEGTYWCLSPMPRDRTVCSVSGWRKSR